jgi:hypothetical protein
MNFGVYRIPSTCNEVALAYAFQRQSLVEIVGDAKGA